MSEEVSESMMMRAQAPTTARPIARHLQALLYVTTICVHISFWQSHIRSKYFSWIQYPWNQVVPICTLIFFILAEYYSLKLFSKKNTIPQERNPQETQETQNQNPQKPRPRNCKQCIRDLVDIGSLFLGMEIQNVITATPNFGDLSFVLSTLFLVISIYIIAKPSIEFGLLDIFIGVGTQFLFYFSKNHLYVWMSIGSLVCAGLVIMRNRYRDIMIEASSNRFLQTFVPHVEQPADSSSTTRDVEQGITQSGPQVAGGDQGLREPLLHGGVSSEILPADDIDENADVELGGGVSGGTSSEIRPAGENE